MTTIASTNSIKERISNFSPKRAPADKARFYRIARRSVTECAAIIDACAVLRLTTDEPALRGRELLLKLVAMLTALILAKQAEARAQG